MKKASRAQLFAFRNRVETVLETEISWFAGWLCADGCITVADERHRPRVQFKITDRDPLERMSLLFGGKVGGPTAPSGLGKRPTFSWGLSGWKAVFVLRRCENWLSERYRQKMKNSLSGFRLQKHGGHKLTPEKVEIIRRELKRGYGSGKRLAKRFGVSPITISAIKHRRIWNEPELRPRVYILGKMTGLPFFNFRLFDEARDRINSFGIYEVISPADLDRQSGFDALKLPPDSDWTVLPKDFNLSETIRKDIGVVLTVDCYAALDGWETSRGATAEKALCDWRGIPRIDWRTGKLYEEKN